MAPPIDIVVVTDEPFQASYLASVLEMELPGLFRVRHVGRDDVGAASGADLLLMQADAAGADVRPMAGLAPASSRAPVIVVARGTLALAVLDRLIHDGADDVLDIAQLNTQGLAAAVLKAVRRRARMVGARTAVSGVRATAT